MKKWTRKMARTVAYVLAVILLGMSRNLPVLASEELQLATLEEAEEFTEVATEEELRTAITNGENVKLTAGITLQDDVVINTPLIVDLNGQTVESNFDVQAFYVSALDVVFRDSSEEQTGCIKGAAHSIHIYSQKSCIIEGGSYNGMPALSNEGTVTITGGSFYGSSGYYSTIQNYGSMTIDGGEIYAGVGCSLEVYEGSRTIIEDCAFKPLVGTEREPMNGDICYNAGTVVVKGMDLSGMTLYNDSGSELLTGALGEESTAIQIPTETHCFLNEIGIAVSLLADQALYTFESIPVEAVWGNSVTDDSLSEGDLSEALSAAAADRNVKYIKLLTGVADAGYVISGGAFTLDLNGNTVIGAENMATFTVTGSGTNVTFTDSDAEESGKIVTPVSSTWGVSALYVEDGATVSIEKGTYVGGYAPLTVDHNGSVIVNGGTFDGSEAYYAACSDGGSLKMIKGMFKGSGSYITHLVSGTMILTGGSFLTNNQNLTCYAVAYSGGTLDMSGVTSSDYAVSFWNTPGEKQVCIPDGYVWHDGSGADGEINAGDALTLEKALTVSFDANGGSGTMAPVSAVEGTYKLPDCTFFAPEGLAFLGWATAADGKVVGDSYTITEDTTFYAVWGEVYDLYVGGVGMKEGAYLASGATEVSATQPATGGYAYYEKGVLTLKDYAYTGERYCYDLEEKGECACVLYSTKDLEVKLEGENLLTNTAYEGDCIVVKGNLTISGSGSLELDAEYSGIRCVGNYDEANSVNSGDVTINGGNVNIVSRDCNGIVAQGSVLINNGIVCIYAYEKAICSNTGIFWQEEVVGLVYPEVANVFHDEVEDLYYLVDASQNPFPKVIIGSDVAHTWSTDYGYNDTAHWHICMDTDCFLRQDASLYALIQDSAYDTHDTNENGICSICGYNANREVVIYVGNLGLADGEYLTNSSKISNTQPTTEGYAYYKNGVLTLKDYAYQGDESDYSAVIYTELEELEIVLQGKNQLKNTEQYGDGIASYGSNLTISGDGSLNITAYDGIYAYGLYDDSDCYAGGGCVTLESGSLIIDAEEDGIDLDGKLSVNGGTLDITTGEDDGIDVDEAVDIVINGGSVSVHADDKGIDSAGDLYIHGGKVNIVSDTDDSADIDGSIHITGGTIILEADDDGLRADEDILLEGGIITIDAGDYGVMTYGDLTIHGGVITITSDLDEEKEDAPVIKVLGELTFGECVELQKPVGGIIDTLSEETDTEGLYDYYEIIVDEAGENATSAVIKEKLQLVEGVTLVENTLTHGETLSVLEFDTVVFKNYRGEIIEGTIAWKTPEMIPDVAITSALWLFTPVNAAYEPVEGSIAIVVREAEPGIEFEDVEVDAYYEEAVHWAVSAGITNGYGSNTTFCPDLICTRGQVVTFLWRANGCPEPTNLENPFTDIAENAYYYKAVLWAVEQGITNGYGSNTIFNPEGECTRGQIATFLWRMNGEPDSSGNNSFTDLETDAFYYEAVLWAVEEGITNGYGSADVFCPYVMSTRAQVVTFLYRGMKGITD